MVQYFPYLLLLMVAIMLLIMLANRLKVAYPILLVLGGLAISLIPNMPAITLNPDLVLIIFLPPLLYADVFSLSLKEMWKWRRIIFSFAFIVVFITAAAVAWVANMVFPGFSLALGFLLGGVIGSTDAVSASTIMKFVKVPKCNTTPEVRKKYVAILHHQREILQQLNKNPRIDEEQIRNFHRQLNLEEEKWEVN